MRHVLFLLCLLSFAHTNTHKLRIMEIKNDVEQKKNHPNIVFMSSCLMVLGANGMFMARQGQIGLVFNLNNRQFIWHLADHRKKVFEASLGTFAAGLIGFCIGKKYYPHQDSSYKNLFSRAALAQKIFNI